MTESTLFYRLGFPVVEILGFCLYRLYFTNLMMNFRYDVFCHVFILFWKYSSSIIAGYLSTDLIHANSALNLFNAF